MFTTFSAWVDLLFKAAGHKYIRRIPYASGGKTRYRYIYKVTHTAGGKHALHEDDVTVGAAFMLGTDKGAEVHAHVKSVDGDKVTVEYDDGPRKGEKETMSKRDLLSKLDAAHGISAALQSEREKQAKVVSELRASGASEKQIAREQARLDRLGAAQSTRQTSVPRSERQTAEVAKPTPPAKGKTEAKPERLRTEAVQIGDRTFRLFPQLSHGGWGFYMSNDTLRAVHLTGDYKGQTRNVAEDMTRAKLEEWLKDPRFQVALSKLDHNDLRGTGMYNLEQLMFHSRPFGVGPIPGTSPKDFQPA